MREPATGRPRVTGPPFRADHVGSLLRPAELLRAREDAARIALVVETALAVWGSL